MVKAAPMLLIATFLFLVFVAGDQAVLEIFDQDIQWRKEYRAPWQTMPSLPPLPPPLFNGTAKVNNVELWYATYGAKLIDSQAGGHVPVVFLHGGFANSEYFSNQINHLKDHPYTLITIDSRAQGRSTDDITRPITYDLMTEDVLSLMDFLQIDRFAVVGWSDGGCISFNLAMNHSTRVDRIFSFGGTYSYHNVNETAMEAQTFSTYMDWVQADYKRLSPSHGSFQDFEQRMLEMWSSEPVWNAQSFAQIPSLFDNPDAPLIWIVAGDSEEAVTRTTPGELHNWIWGSSLVTLPSVSHFAFLQDPVTFSLMLERFLAIEK